MSTAILDLSQDSLIFTPKPSEQIISQFNSRKLDFASIKIISFSHTYITIDTFSLICGDFSQFVSLQVLDLSQNYQLTSDFAQSIYSLLKNNPKVWINLFCTNFALSKGIRKLHSEFLNIDSDRTVISKLLTRVIIMSKDFINRAQTSPTYSQLIEEGILDSNWFTYHREYYTLPILTDLYNDRELKSCERFHRDLHLIGLRSDIPSVTIDASDASDSSDEENSLSFSQCIEMMLPRFK